VSNQLLEKLEYFARGEHDYTRRVHVLLRLTLDQAGLGHGLEGVADMTPAGLEVLCRRFDIACTPGQAREVLGMHGLPQDEPFPLHDFIAKFARSEDIVCLHPRAGDHFPTSPRTPRGNGETLATPYRVVSGQSDEAALLRARLERAQSPRFAPVVLTVQELATTLLVKMEAFAHDHDFARKLMIVLREGGEHSNGPQDLEAPRFHAEGYPHLVGGMDGRVVVTPRGLQCICLYFNLRVSEAQAASLLSHFGFTPSADDGPTLTAFCDRVLHDDSAYVINKRQLGADHANPRVAAAFMMMVSGQHQQRAATSA